MHAIRIEFEDLGFKAMHPMRSARIYQAVKRARGNRKEIVNKIEESLSHCLAIDEIEKTLALDTTPMPWPVGRGRDFLGTYDILTGGVRLLDGGGGVARDCV